MHHVIQKSEVFRERFHMPIILPNWVLEAEFLSKNALSPLGFTFVPKYPALHVLCFNYEYTIDQDKNVVDLGGFTLAWNHQIVDAPVNLAVKAKPPAKLRPFFAKPAFEQLKH